MVIGQELDIAVEMLLTRMQQHGDGRTLTYFALHLYIAVMQVHQFFGQVHTDTRTRRIRVIEFVIAGETLKEHAAFLRCDTDTFVLHGQHDKSGFVGDDNADVLTGRCELKRVTQQVP